MSELIIDADVIANNTVLDAELESVVILGGGGGGTTNYNALSNKPQINGVTLQGNKSISDLGLDVAIETEVADYVEEHKDELKGDKGDDGYSPSARVQQSSGGAIVTVTDESGTTTATISNGVDGTNGNDGQDGFSPIASVSKVGNTTTISITDKTHTTTAQVSDGAKGDTGDTGNSGVYIGSSEPSDPDVNVWINPQGESTELLESSDLVANPTLSGDETSLSSIGIKGTNYKLEGSSGGGSWGSITGNISNQTDLQSALDEKANENAIDGMVDDRFVTAFQLNSVSQKQAIIDILLALGFTREELPDPVVPQTGTWQYKTTPTKGYIILGKDDDTHDEAMFVRMASGYGFPVTLNSIYGNAYDISSHKQTDDADSEYSQYPVGSVSRLPEGGTIHDINMIVINNDLGEIALHGYNAIWDSDNVTDETWNTIYSNYTTGGGTKTKAEMIQALKDDYAGWDLSQGATEFVQARADLKSDLHTVIQTIGTWGVTHNFYVDDIAVASPSDLNISAWNVAREFNYWGAGIVTTNGNDVQDPWEYPRRSGGLASVQNLADACQYAYDHYGVVEVFTHQFFNGHGTQEQWTLFKSLMDELKDWVDDGKIEVVTRYEYSQLGEIVQNPITSLQFAPTSQSFSVGSQITESDFTCNAVFQDLTTSTCANDRVIDLSQINTTVAGTYTATLLYRGFKQTCTVTVSNEPAPTYILSNKTYSDSQMVRSTNICPESVPVESGKTYRFEFDFLAETETLYALHYIKLASSYMNGWTPRYWGEMNYQIDTTQGTTTAHITVDCVSGATRTLENLFSCDILQNTTVGAWTISNLYMWEVAT